MWRTRSRSCVGQDRLVDLQAPVLAGLVDAEQVGPRADQGHQRHHQLLADRVDGRVGDLGEVLLEVGRAGAWAGCDSTEGGLSAPMEPTASWPVTTIGVSRNLMSSWV